MIYEGSSEWSVFTVRNTSDEDTRERLRRYPTRTGWLRMRFRFGIFNYRAGKMVVIIIFVEENTFLVTSHVSDKFYFEPHIQVNSRYLSFGPSARSAEYNTRSSSVKDREAKTREWGINGRGLWIAFFNIFLYFILLLSLSEKLSFFIVNNRL